jgi:hypothetical protein
LLRFFLSLDYSKKPQGKNLKCQIFIQHFCPGLNNSLWWRSKLNIKKWNAILYKANTYNFALSKTTTTQLTVNNIFISILFDFRIWIIWIEISKIYGFRSSTRLLCRKFILFGLKKVQLGAMILLFSSFLFIISKFYSHRELFVGYWSLMTSVGGRSLCNCPGLNNSLWWRSKLNIKKWNAILYKTNTYFCIEENNNTPKKVRQKYI